jgi:hypothetical protein
MNPADQKWPRLAAAARRAQDPRDPAAPYGFATRVAALALAQERAVASLFERFSWRALGVAGLLAAISLAGNYSTLVSAFQNDSVSVDDPVAEIVDIAT